MELPKAILVTVDVSLVCRALLISSVGWFLVLLIEGKCIVSDYARETPS